ncbi:LVIVD repeat-containing protein [Prosthecobacter vanneervenii]|uniref:Uncharacterized protein n=1 Tax=Prosthecobacter vanneervenii TaxID=48466 RepID=A0A7W8DKM2_9BACT|nr:hypothetical protein [Prosthecobacter vanneervenii]MBB5033006.1 hypothetical protein [Prosthecobacter vanneervenii]
MRCFARPLCFLLMMFLAAQAYAQHASTPIQRPGPEFGEELQTEALHLGDTMDVAVAGDHVFAIGKGELRILSNARVGKPALIGKLEGLGNTRQIAISRGHAFITSREDGMFIVDVREPSGPRLVHHYDTAELATAVAVSGDVAAVGNRFAGIELLDVSHPEQPRHLSTIRCGEVQSLVFHGTWLCAGTWSEKTVAVIDARDPWKPALVKMVPLDGKGDGLDVSGNMLAVATGHHARTKGIPKPGGAAYGSGHGVEFFDITNPADPQRLSGVKFPPFYRLGMDMWGVVLAGGHAFVNDTHNGFFLIDVRDPAKPRNIGWTQLPKIKGDPSPVAGLAVAQGRVFLAGGFDDLHLVETGIRDAEPVLTEGGLQVPKQPAEVSAHGLPKYVVEGSIRSVVPWKDDLLLVAAGSAGWHIVRQTSAGFEPVSQHPTRGFARDVAFEGDHVFVAESLGGLSIWQKQPSGGLQRLGAYEVPGKSIHQVVLADEGRIAFLAVGANALHVIKISHDGKTELVMPPVMNTGLFYRDPISPLSADGRRVLVQWHVTGLHEFIIENGTVKRGSWTFPHAMDTECGATPWQDAWLATSHRGFFTLAEGETRPAEKIGLLKPADRIFPGKPSLSNATLYIADPFLGDVSAFDMSDAANPKLTAELHLTGHPGRVVVHQGHALIPAGREGLLLWNR